MTAVFSGTLDGVQGVVAGLALGVAVVCLIRGGSSGRDSGSIRLGLILVAVVGLVWVGRWAGG